MTRLRWMLWVIGAYLAANVLWAIVRARLVLPALALMLTGCGASIVLLSNPQGHVVECRDDLWDGIPDTIGKCVRAYEAVGYRVRTSQ